MQGITMLLPSNASDPASMVAQSIEIYKNMMGHNFGNDLPAISDHNSDVHWEVNENEIPETAKAPVANHPGFGFMGMMKDSSSGVWNEDGGFCG
ncbi:hypothetical protein RJ640_029614 [Escallonia rubra]|uniref:STML2-like C-terminal extension domain-containing protein n=1 Tax=Escallonia rubra TaxID=112253 RepID=A0AA88RSI0_9ASTE|nr:hypothetical protein RJ640_029614 [Escallonia rubra]